MNTSAAENTKVIDLEHLQQLSYERSKLWATFLDVSTGCWAMMGNKLIQHFHCRTYKNRKINVKFHWIIWKIMWAIFPKKTMKMH